MESEELKRLQAVFAKLTAAQKKHIIELAEKFAAEQKKDFLTTKSTKSKKKNAEPDS
jgi:SAM-dependent MidA family methyltransferase